MDKNGDVGGDEEMMVNNNNNIIIIIEDDQVVTSINKTLKELPLTKSKSFMCKVPKLHRKMNETVYTPQVISIGPFHHGQKELMDAEQYKVLALKKYLSRTNMTVNEVTGMAYSWEEKARSCYEHPIHMNKQDFAKMMLFDGCFILEFTMTSTNDKWSRLRQGEVERDLTLFENQLPFFVLQQLYDKTLVPENNDQHPAKQSYNKSLLEWMATLVTTPMNEYSLPCNVRTNEVRHLVDLLRFYYKPSPETDEYKKFEENECFCRSTSPTITKLYEAGVKIQRAWEAESMMDFSFKNGVLKIPHFIIHTNFEIQIRNLIVYEMSNAKGEKYVYHYLSLLYDLIKTEKDVSILVKEEVIINETHYSDEQVLKLIHHLHLIAPTFRPNHSYFDNMSGDLNDYCNRPMASIHRSMTLLKRDYFNTPWASISCVAAIFLLILTCIQTLFSAPSFFHKK